MVSPSGHTSEGLNKKLDKCHCALSVCLPLLCFDIVDDTCTEIGRLWLFNFLCLLVLRGEVESVGQWFDVFLCLVLYCGTPSC